MAFTEDMDPFFNGNDFALEAVITLNDNSTRKLNVIFDEATDRVDLYDQNIEANVPTVTCKTSDLTGVKTRKQLTVSGKTFSIERIAHDGTGVSTIYLKN
jgi:hypothetical protein